MLRTSILVACFLFFLFGDKLIILVETIWKNLSSKIYEPTDSSDPFTDFASLDETIIDVITETKIKFEDVAGNEEAKDELKEVVIEKTDKKYRVAQSCFTQQKHKLIPGHFFI
jgi:ATP-dependent Zn protease